MLVEKSDKRQALFWEKVNIVEDGDSCWPWIGAKNCNGYGWITVYIDKKQKFFFAHKVSYEWEFGEIPSNMIIRHRCDNPPCVRPSHLIPGTYKQNSQDMVERKRHVGSREIDEITALEIRQKRARGMLTKDLSKEYDLSASHISSICTGLYWPNVGGPLTRRFELSDELILLITIDLQNMSQAACAIKHGVSKSIVQQIASGKRKPRFLESLVAQY